MHTVHAPTDAHLDTICQVISLKNRYKYNIQCRALNFTLAAE